MLIIWLGEYRGENKKMYGKMRFWRKNGDVCEGYCEDSKLNGKGTFWFKNGNIYEGNMEEDFI